MVAAAAASKVAAAAATRVAVAAATRVAVAAATKAAAAAATRVHTIVGHIKINTNGKYTETTTVTPSTEEDVAVTHTERGWERESARDSEPHTERATHTHARARAHTHSHTLPCTTTAPVNGTDCGLRTGAPSAS